MSLRRLLTPFFKATHPDLLSHASTQVKRTNERSLQQLNTIIDTLEHLGGRATGAGSGAAAVGGGRPGPQPQLEAAYELTFHLVEHQQQQQRTDPEQQQQPQPPPQSQSQSQSKGSFTARLLFPPPAVARLRREAPLSPSAAITATGTTSTPQQPLRSSPFLIPDEIARQLRKLFQGARLPVPQELAAADPTRGSAGGQRPRGRRGGLIGAAAAERMLVADLMARDLRVQGPTPAQRRAAVLQLLRSGRVLTRGLASPAAEVGALRQLEQVLVQEWDRAHLDVAGVGGGGGNGGGGIQIVLDAEAETLSWRVLEEDGEGGEGEGHLVIVPAEDVRGCRYRLAAVLREIGRRAMAAREAAGAQAAAAATGRRV